MSGEPPNIPKEVWEYLQYVQRMQESFTGAFEGIWQIDDRREPKSSETPPRAPGGPGNGTVEPNQSTSKG